VVLLAVFAIAPLEYPGAFQSHTGLLAVYNLINLDQNPWQFFNWAPAVGRAYDLFRSDGALPYLIAEIFHLVGFGYLDSIKLVYALAWVASGLTMYALARKLVVSRVEPFFSDAGALLAATVYVYLPYHIATVYVRGAFAEAVAWAVMPGALLALFSVNSQQSTVNSRQIFAFRLLPFALLFLTQPGIAILFAPVALAIVVALHWRESIGSQPSAVGGRLVAIFGGLLLGTLLTVPTMLRYGANVARDGFAANFVLPFQLFSSQWGFSTSTGNYLDQFPLQLGVVPIGLAIIAVALGWNRRGDPEPVLSHALSRVEGEAEGWSPDQGSHRGLPLQSAARRVVAVFLGAAVVLTLLTFEIAAPLWSVLGAFVTYPWQLLAFVGLALALVAGAAVEFDARLARPAMLAVFVALPIVASYGYLAPRFLDVNPTRPQIATFGNNEIALWDYRIVGPLQHGATIRLQLTWQALRLVDHDYTVFVHAVHEDGKTYGQVDSKPREGTLPTLRWTPGQVLADTHTIQIDVEGPREGYHLEVGLYNAATGNRAILSTGADHLILPRPGDPEPTITDQVRPKP
jgi:hypothetical protein